VGQSRSAETNADCLPVWSVIPRSNRIKRCRSRWRNNKGPVVALMHWLPRELILDLVDWNNGRLGSYFDWIGARRPEGSWDVPIHDLKSWTSHRSKAQRIVL